jgi:hypothetical protein
MERLLGKSPLKLVLARTLISKGVWKEKLECGHEVTTFQECLWADNSSLIAIEPTAKRRRCQKCKPADAPKLQTRAEITADQKRVELIRERKYKFGALFDKLCFPNGELRPGPSADELEAQLNSLTVPSPSPRKPVQSVRSTTNRKEAF